MIQSKETLRRQEEACTKILIRELKLEQDAVDGTLKSLKNRTNDSVILDRVEAIIKHSEMIGRLKLAIEKGVGVI